MVTGRVDRLRWYVIGTKQKCIKKNRNFSEWCHYLEDLKKEQESQRSTL